ncbi:hypothetical protein DERF_010038 [Dermatophagoides farinae]|uniref:Uncharacterized protein n=1 Tax=Dermatophagoides farinae TaxID=6954 RepID=A0A922HW69_DERFA|nr:hypothetical protein DERF_010038 [Dermatophagoides farinae]
MNNNNNKQLVYWCFDSHLIRDRSRILFNTKRRVLIVSMARLHKFNWRRFSAFNMPSRQMKFGDTTNVENQQITKRQQNVNRFKYENE